MFDKKTEEKINEAVTLELTNACNLFGNTFHTLHEGYAVVKEELEETENDLEFVKDHFNSLWDAVKADNAQSAKESAYMIAYNAIELAKEACQIAAVARKIIGE